MSRPTTTSEIRSAFLEFFREREHEVVASAPLVPLNDPTLLFTNAGMVPFKDVFTGAETRAYDRAASSQKCLRAGGKHNDLDNVGYTARHHTFFEMLGNFSFGDYFKEKAIAYAWEFVTGVLQLPSERLIATVYHTDEEAYALWQKVSDLPDERILRISGDNFWSMGDTGPCGPCAEVFYDHGPEVPGGPPGSAEEDGDRFVEIWNLVFMQYDQQEDGTRVELPRPSIDTGMGLERVAAVMQDTCDNYQTDLFRKLIEASVEATGVSADSQYAPSHRVIADHLRAVSFLIADGVLPANEGRGYVLRRIMRRAMRHAHMLGVREPLLHRLVPVLSQEMGEAFPELPRAEALVSETLRMEEDRFQSMLDRGLRILADELEKLPANAPLPGEVAFKLYDTYGFPLDLTQDALRARGRSVDTEGFERAMEEQRAKARAAWAGSGDSTTEKVWYAVREEVGASEFIGYTSERGEARVEALVRDGERLERAEAGEEVEVVVNQTPFYAESGGQIGDTGEIRGPGGTRLRVTDTQAPVDTLYVHSATVESGTVRVGDQLSLMIDSERRRRTRANHSATHLLHAALKKHLGAHVAQKGSLVAPDRLRFDFTHPGPLSADEIAAIETEINAQIQRNSEVATRVMGYDEAMRAGAVALFGEKYDEEVRVLTMGEDDDERAYSVELCGGTHVRRLGDIALFKIVDQTAVGSGVRRLEALTGEGARQHLLDEERKLQDAAARLKTRPEELPERVAQLSETAKNLERELAETKKKLALGGGQGAASGGPGPEPEEIGGIKFLGQVLEGVDPKQLRGLGDEAKKTLGSGIAAFVTVNAGKAALLVAVTADLTDRVSAVDLVRRGAEALGGKGGGGRADMAQAGGPDGQSADRAVARIREAVAGLKEAAE